MQFGKFAEHGSNGGADAHIRILLDAVVVVANKADGRVIVKERHVYPHSRGGVLRYIGEQLDRAAGMLMLAIEPTIADLAASSATVPSLPPKRGMRTKKPRPVRHPISGRIIGWRTDH